MFQETFVLDLFYCFVLFCFKGNLLELFKTESFIYLLFYIWVIQFN